MSEDNSRNHDSSATHKRLQHSTTLNRRYVQRPGSLIQLEDAEAIQQEMEAEQEIAEEAVQQAETERAMQQAQAKEVMQQAQVESDDASSEIMISSFAKCQAENLRRRQELADKINRERSLAMQQKRLQRGYVAAESQQESMQGSARGAAQESAQGLAKQIKVMAITDEEPEEEWETEEAEETKHIGEAEWITPEPEHADEAEWIIPEVKHADERRWEAPEPECGDKWGMVQELPMQRAANERLARTWNEPVSAQQPTAQELKDAAIRKAMRSVATMEAAERKEETKKLRRHEKRHMQVRNRKRIALAIVCAVAVVGGIGYFVATNMPSVSYGAMAMQSGIDLSGLWVPRDFTLITSSAGEGSLSVTYAKGEDQFILTAETSTWDSQTLLNNYVTTTWRGYDVVKDQDKTIYISGSNAAWVSGGVRYILEAKNGILTNKQIKTIAASL